MSGRVGPPSGRFGRMVGRIPVLDVTPSLEVRAATPPRPRSARPSTVTATVFREGHDALTADVVLVDPAGARRPPVRMRRDADGHRPLARPRSRRTAEGAWTFEVEAWSDPVATWRHDAEIKIPAGIDVELMFAEGALLLERAADDLERPGAGERRARTPSTALRDTDRPDAGAARRRRSSPTVADVLAAHPLRELRHRRGPVPVLGRPASARCSAPGTSSSPAPRARRRRGDRHGGQRAPSAPPPKRLARGRGDGLRRRSTCRRSTRSASVNRKGRNNTLTPGPDDVGSPWAIGSAEGGHDAIHPDLGTLEDFDAFVGRGPASSASRSPSTSRCRPPPTTPGSTEHPEWFTTRADGTIAYAENPPKKYQDIYPINFDNDPEGIYAEVLRVVRHWMDHGVRIFRVDNPHTKPVAFWEWLLGEVRTHRPRRDLPGRGVHPAGDDARARHGRLPPDLHLLHLAQPPSAEIEEYLTRAVARDRRTCMRPELLRQHPRHPARVPAVRRPGGVQDPRRRWPRPARRPGACTPASSCSSTSPCARAARSTSTPRSTRSGSADWDGRRGRGPVAGAVPHAAQPGPPRSTRRCSSCATSRSTTPTDDSIVVFSKTAQRRRRRDDTVIVVVNVDPHATRETHRPPGHAGAGPGLGGPVRGARRGHRRTSWTLGRAQLRPPRPVPRARPHPAPSDEARDDPADATPRPGAAIPRLQSDRPGLVQDRRLLRGARPSFRGQQRRRHRRLPRAHREARLPPVARRRLPVGAAVLHLAAARRRLRRRRLHRRSCPRSARCDDFREFLDAGARAAASG